MSSVKEVSDATFKHDVLESSKPVLVDFFAPWCGPCKMLAPVLESISDKFSPGLIVAKLNTDNNQETAYKYQISGVPCLIVFENGGEVDRIVGFMPENALEERLKAYKK